MIDDHDALPLQQHLPWRRVAGPFSHCIMRSAASVVAGEWGATALESIRAPEMV